MGFTRFVEIGRVALINYGPDEGKLCTIIDVVDHNKALIDGPEELTGVKRQMIPFKRLALTDFKVKILRNARQGTLKKAFAEADVLAKWGATAWARKRAAKAKRASLGDLDRFKLMIARKQKARAVNTALAKLKKSA
ncbi:ribosomal protein L14-domain-containing protein [Tribonema minus]|uniref:Ribosomal protein L14-domain-containing protein n=1 Tax=Tribonema minus TaxID=303371 RepID=A0A835YLN7_9STRA|nr:ribosomal protein L14-domain-containing protein [Tribonema minus]